MLTHCTEIDALHTTTQRIEKAAEKTVQSTSEQFQKQEVIASERLANGLSIIRITASGRNVASTAFSGSQQTLVVANPSSQSR